MSIETFLHLEALEHTKQDLASMQQKLTQFLALDMAKAQADLEAGVAYFQAEVARIRGAVDPRVLAHLDEGAPPQIAVQLAESGAPTNAETAASILAAQQAVVQPDAPGKFE